MNNEQKIKKLKSRGWQIHFNEIDFIYEVKRGILKYKSKSITEYIKKLIRFIPPK